MTAELSSINPNTSLRGVVVSPIPTGREPELLQDCDRKLSRALANTPGARLHAREAAAASVAVSPPVKPADPLQFAFDSVHLLRIEANRTSTGDDRTAGRIAAYSEVLEVLRAARGRQS